MPRTVECVPNFSEGREIRIINAIAGAAGSVEGIKLLNVEPDRDYHRTVVTFVGDPDGVVEAAFRATAMATELIDMSRHHGEHPRIGAMDVVPFVPVSGLTMEECVALSRSFGERVGRELGIPVYLYEAAATSPARKNLANVRKGEYEGLAAKLQDPLWAPDFGPAEFRPRSGATVTGARMFLIAYNVNLATNDVAIANEIALRIRESGRVQKDGDGKVLLDASGQKTVIPGTLRAVKAMGVLLEAHDLAQVSMNLVDFHLTPPHVAYAEVRRQAAELGTEVTGSEIVGLIPKDALLAAGKHARPEASLEEEILEAAVTSLGLDQLAPFDLKTKIIEYRL
jgi:glutamate formiminotransferase/formiminotetrahydrofolate cyclodeaminase